MNTLSRFAGRLGTTARTALVAPFLLLFLGSAACAQMIDMQSADAYFEQLREQLDLTDEQVELMRPIVEESSRQQREILKKHEIDLNADENKRIGRRQAIAVRREMQGVRKEMLEDLEAVLTDEQLKEFAAMQEAQAEARRATMRERFRRQ